MEGNKNIEFVWTETQFSQDSARLLYERVALFPLSISFGGGLRERANPGRFQIRVQLTTIPRADLGAAVPRQPHTAHGRRRNPALVWDFFLNVSFSVLKIIKVNNNNRHLLSKSYVPQTILNCTWIWSCPTTGWEGCNYYFLWVGRATSQISSVTCPWSHS